MSTTPFSCSIQSRGRPSSIHRTGRREVAGLNDIENFQLPSSDSLKIFAYYTQHRDLWPRNRQVQGPEIDGLLKALDSELPQTPRTTRVAAGACPIWNLRRVEAHRFGGLHRHCGPAGEDPEPFVLEIDKDLTLISGFNGAGKTALLSSIIWCLTGKALRSQHMPDEVHGRVFFGSLASCRNIGTGCSSPDPTTVRRGASVRSDMTAQRRTSGPGSRKRLTRLMDRSAVPKRQGRRTTQGSL